MKKQEVIRPSRPPPPPSTKSPMELEVQDLSENQYKNQFNAFDNTPTNTEISLLKKACDESEQDDLESLYPSVPLR